MVFSQLAQYFRQIEQTSSRLEMTRLLAELFNKSDSGDIGMICYLLGGRVVPLYEALEFGMADKFVIRAIMIAFGVSREDVLDAFRKYGDLGAAAEANYRQKRKAKNRSVHDVYEALYEIALTSGVGSQEMKIAKLADLFASVDSLSVRYIARIPLDKLRLGFSEMTILDALSWMLVGDKSLREKLEAAYNIRPDIGYIANQVKEHGIGGVSRVRVKVGAPILAALCQRLPTADEMIKKMGEVVVEPKYDGVRVQIHFQKSVGVSQREKQQVKETVVKKGIILDGGLVRSFSRNLENTTEMFPELHLLDTQVHAHDVILDSEAVGIDPKSGKILPFQTTTTRKRKHQVDLFTKDVPLKFFVFDILYKDGKDLLGEPLQVRRKILDETIKRGPILEPSPYIVTSSADEIRAYHDTQRKKGLEGAVVKKWLSPYEPGRRGFSWVKFKEEEGHTGKLTDTIDGVVMGYYLGEGKRSGFGIGAFLIGVRDKDTFVTVTKIGTGVSDMLWKELLIRFDKLKISQQPKEYVRVSPMLVPDVWIEPKIVVEVAGDDLTKSPNHGAGVAIRFPRLVKIREDKGPRDATTLREIEQMYKNQ
jgi:DNA ligase 1